MSKSTRQAPATSPKEPSSLSMSDNIDAADEHDDIMYPSTLPFILLHVSCFAAFWTGITWQAVAICVALYWLRMFAIGGGISSLFLAPGLFDQPAVSIRPRVPGAKHRAKERAVVGRQAPASSSAFRYASMTCIRRGTRASSTAMSAGFFPGSTMLTDLVKVADFSSLSGTEVAAQIRAAARGDPRACSAFWIAGWSGLVVGFVWSTVLRLSRDFLHQFAGACARPQALRDRRRFPQQLAARVLHHGRRLAQQPSRLSEQRSPGLPLVGNRCHLLCPEGAVFGRASSGT